MTNIYLNFYLNLSTFRIFKFFDTYLINNNLNNDKDQQILIYFWVKLVKRFSHKFIKFDTVIYTFQMWAPKLLNYFFICNNLKSFIFIFNKEIFFFMYNFNLFFKRNVRIIYIFYFYRFNLNQLYNLFILPSKPSILLLSNHYFSNLRINFKLHLFNFNLMI